MRIDPEELRRHYASLSDEALLEVSRADLTDIAVGCYDTEIFHRGLNRREEPAAEEPPLEDAAAEDSAQWGEARRIFMSTVPWAKNAAAVHTFHSAPEAEQARDILEEAGITNAIAGDESASFRFNLMVPESSLEAAKRVLDSQIFHPLFEATLESHFAVFTDDELLGMDRELLPQTARASYDAELDQRGLGRSVGDTSPETSTTVDGFVAVATLFRAEAGVGQRMLEQAGLACRLEDDDAPTPLEDFQGVRLMVPPAQFDEACRILQDNEQAILDAGRGDAADRPEQI